MFLGHQSAKLGATKVKRRFAFATLVTQLQQQLQMLMKIVQLRYSYRETAAVENKIQFRETQRISVWDSRRKQINAPKDRQRVRGGQLQATARLPVNYKYL